MKLVLQRAVGDCGIAALATLIEQTYEDIFVEMAKIDTKRRGRNGVHLGALVTLAARLGARLRLRKKCHEDDEGLLVVRWAEGSKHEIGVSHLVVYVQGIVIDPADGVILPLDEYLAREVAESGSFLELR